MKNGLDSSGWLLRWLPFRFKCGNARHFENALQYGTRREKMEGISEMPSISVQREHAIAIRLVK